MREDIVFDVENGAVRKIDQFLWLESKKLQPNIKTHIWRVFATIGDKFFKKYPPKIYNEDLRLLNLGCGDVLITGFVNADFYRLQKWLSKDRCDWMLDITRPIKCHDEYWDGIILEHVNEHITYVSNYRLFQELHRTIKKGGVLRLVMPDLDTYLQYVQDGNADPKMNRYGSFAEAISNLTQNHAHVTTWNFDLLRDVLLEIGFSKVERCSFRQGSLPALLVDSPNHQWQSLYCEATK